MAREDGRRRDRLRPVTLERGFLENHPASVLVTAGKTRVLCAATAGRRVPSFLRDTGTGWVTAEYSLLPASTASRRPRERRGIGGRTAEIQRFIGRVLRAVVDREALGARTITLDCDVLEADGGTRTAALTGAWVALSDCVAKLEADGAVSGEVVREPVAAVSAGVLEGKPILDLSYVEDCAASVDMNVAMTASGEFVEIQGTAEGETFGRDELDEMLRLAGRGIRKLIDLQREALGR